MANEKITHGACLIIEKLLRWCVHPYLRAFLLKLLGADIGRNVRIYEITLFNLTRGFKNLVIEDDAHIGPGTMLDLSDKIIIKKGAVLSPRTLILTHSDPGSRHKSPLREIYPPKTLPVEIGAYSWIGASTVILCGTKIGNYSVVGAGSLVNADIPANTLACGSPAKIIKESILSL